MYDFILHKKNANIKKMTHLRMKILKKDSARWTNYIWPSCEPYDLAGAILFFLQEPEREPGQFKKLKWIRSWSWHKLLWLQASAVFKNFAKNNDF